MSIAIPPFGIGTYKLDDQAAERVVAEALELGYRHIDTAAMYGNEAGVGRALRASGLAREQVFVTTKLNNPDHAPDAARAAMVRSLDALGLEQVDLYLIHWPMARTTDYVATWETLLEMQRAGQAKSVGVSNFQIPHLEAVTAATGVVPSVNQVELHPHLTQAELRAWHDAHGVVTEAWSPLARGSVLADPAIVALAAAHDVTPAQLVLAWHLAVGNVVFPKASSRARLAENLASVDVVLAPDVVAEISALDQGRRSGSHPDQVELAS